MNRASRWCGRRRSIGELAVVKIGSQDQPVLAKQGDDLRIDWGYLYRGRAEARVARAHDRLRRRCSRRVRRRRRVCRSWTLRRRPAPPTMTLRWRPWSSNAARSARQPVSRWLMLAYDDLYSIQYMKQNLRPYWRRNGWEAADLLKAAASEYEALQQRCAAFDEELMADLTRAGGENYAKLAALAYRQCFAAGKFVADDNGQPLSFCKENHSNGCIGTSDVFYPMAPQFLLFGPSLAKSFLVPFMNYAASDRWKFPFAPHDLGTYPHANGQVYGGGERTEENQMPVEESGNLLMLMAAVAQMEGNADFAGLYWPQLEKWAEYLKAKGFDPGEPAVHRRLRRAPGPQREPERQGHLRPRCVRQAVRDARRPGQGGRVRQAGEGVRRPLGEGSRRRRSLPPGLRQARHVEPEVQPGLGPHPRPEPVPAAVAAQGNGLLPQDAEPLRPAARQPADLHQARLDPLDRDADAGPGGLRGAGRPGVPVPERNARPLADDRLVSDRRRAKKVGFTARPVVGGVFLQMLYDKAVWAKYAGRDRPRPAAWAPMPSRRCCVTVVPTADEEAVVWRYTTRRPGGGWFSRRLRRCELAGRPGRLRHRGTPGAIVRTDWNTRDIWLRREFTLPDGEVDNVGFQIHHDEDVEIYINGVLAATANGLHDRLRALPLTPAAGRRSSRARI